MTQMTSMLNRHASHIVEVVEGGLQPAGLAPHVTRSWSRCLRDFGIEPTARRSNVVLSAPSVKESQQHLGSLLAVAQAEMESLYEQIAGSGFAVILSDTQGTVLSMITDPSLRREFRHG